MLPYKIHTFAPYLKDKTRLMALTSGSAFGYNEIHEEHMIERLNNIIGNLDNESVYQTYYDLRNREMPDLERRVNTGPISSDMLLYDNFRQHNEIMTRYRKRLPNLHDIRKISEGAMRYHISCSRGYERHLVNFISQLDTEMLDRQNIKPIIV